MRRIISIAGLPCCGKTTLCNSFAASKNAISLDLEYLRTIFFEEDLENNLFKYTHFEPMKDNEDLRAYFLRCAIYDNVITFEEYVEWYKIIMIYMNNGINKIIEDFDNLDYTIFLSKYSKLIKEKPIKKPNLILLNHALLPLTDIWNISDVTIMLTGEDDILINRFMVREKTSKKYTIDILRHLSLYKVLNNEAIANIIYDTTKDFIDIRLLEKYYNEGEVNYEQRS